MKSDITLEYILSSDMLSKISDPNIRKRYDCVLESVEPAHFGVKLELKDGYIISVVGGKFTALSESQQVISFVHKKIFAEIALVQSDELYVHSPFLVRTEQELQSFIIACVTFDLEQIVNCIER